MRQEVKLSYAMADAASLNRPASNQLRCSIWFQSEPQVESSGLSQGDLSRVNASRFICIVATSKSKKRTLCLALVAAALTGGSAVNEAHPGARRGAGTVLGAGTLASRGLNVKMKSHTWLSFVLGEGGGGSQYSQ